MTSDIASKLDQLANFRAQKEVLALQKQELIDQVLTAEIKARLNEIEAEFSDKVSAVEENIQLMEDDIKQAVLEQGASVHGTFLRAIWYQGRVTWDNKKMDEYAIYHPEVLSFRKQGKPYVSIGEAK
jgi:hypothetical protein